MNYVAVTEQLQNLSLCMVADIILMQELLVIDDLLSALVGIEGRYISIKRVRGKEGYVVFQIDSSMDLALQVDTKCIVH